MSSKNFILGGDIKKSLVEGYRFDLKKLLSDAFQVTKKNFLPLLSACIFIMVVFFTLASLMIVDLNSLNDPMVIGVFFVASILVAPPLMTGLMMMGVHHSIGLKTNSLHLFNYFKIILKLSLAALMITLVTNAIGKLLTLVFGDLGFMLSIVALLYLKMSFCLVYPLIAEKQVSPLNALKLSFKLVHKNIGQFSVLLIIFITLLAFGAITSGLGLFFVIPFSINLLGIIYRQICGVGVSVSETTDNEPEAKDDDQDSGSNNGNFEA
ncbi:hypothetical protein [Psychromonas aquatilis]|uniref:Membrane protein YesL n=1 Tax=Psychromonas aquatilis TaxID=2005072 RepID=A0ABU9GQJ4_9GAMM